MHVKCGQFRCTHGGKGRPALDCADLNSDSTIPESQDEPFLLLERVGGRGGTSTKVQDQDQAAGGRQGRLCGPLGR